MTGQPTDRVEEPREPRSLEEEITLLAVGELELQGRIMPASNATFFGTVTLDGAACGCVYKPVSGERPLWDFPDGTLARREAAAYVVSEALGWSVVPTTLLREGPAGIGMLQAWREPDPSQDAVDIVASRRLPEGYLHVLDAHDDTDRPVSLIHEDSEPLRRMAVFDVIVNNADRKGGHVLAMTDGHRHGVDHGLSFHVEDKLRTVLWGWTGRPLTESDTAGVTSILDQLTTPDSDLDQALSQLLTVSELDATMERCERLLRRAAMPRPSRGWPSIPWPAF